MQKLYLLICFCLCLSQVAQAQVTVTGNVTDENGAGLPGATVVEKGTANGTITNASGQYTLTVANENAVLVLSFLGYQTEQEQVNGRSTIDVQMYPDITALQEIVVVGYGTQDKRDVTGSLVTADLEAFEEAPNTNILQALSGTVPGIDIGQTTQAGSEPRIRVRGQTSINGNQNPLIVLDGAIYRGQLGDLNPKDIASIDILKDASSQAIYGAQAANGVILVTTKKGKGAKKPTINYSTFYSTQSPANELEPLDRNGFVRAIRDVAFDPSRIDDPDFVNSYIGPGFTQENPDWTVENNSLLLDPQVNGFNNGTDFNWFDAVTDPGFIMDHQLSISGGTDKTSYFISGGYTQQEGWMLNDEFDRTSIRINLDTDVTDWLKIGANTFGAFSDFSGNTPSLNRIVQMSPLVTPTDENGELVVNPLGNVLVNPFLQSQADDRDNRNNLSGIFYALVTVPQIEGLTYRVNFSHNYRTLLRGNSNVFGAGLTGSASKETSSEYDMLLDNIVNYKKTFGNGDHAIDVTLVAGLNSRSFEQTRAAGQNFSNLRLSYNNIQQAAVQTISSSAWEEDYLYQTGRINYDYKTKYLLTATLRRDGFSGFSEDNKYGLFPSVGVGWVLSEEAFLNSVPNLNVLKLRASYGTNGNLTDRYSSLARVVAEDDSRYVFGEGGTTVNGQSVESLENTDLTWETTTGINLGLDFELFESRISGSLDVYQSTTTDLLWDLVVPRATGFEEIRSNVGEVKNQGIELILSANPVNTGDFRWDFTFNLASNRNEIQELLGVDADGDGREDDLISDDLFIGESIGSIFGYRTDGLWQLEDMGNIPDGYFVGTQRIIDTDGVEGITPDDRVILGRTEPAYSFGFQNTIAYKNFTFRFFIKSIQGGSDGYLALNDPWRDGSTDSPGNAQANNWFSEVDYWSTTNTDATFRRPGVVPAIDAQRYFDRSFIRLQDISLAYTVPQTLVDKLGMQGLKVFVSGKNLLTFTDWEGWDPETGQGLSATVTSRARDPETGESVPTGGLPVMRGFSVGLDISF